MVVTIWFPWETDFIMSIVSCSPSVPCEPLPGCMGISIGQLQSYAFGKIVLRCDFRDTILEILVRMIDNMKLL